MICPACQRRLHVDALASSSVHPAICPLSIEGVIRHPGTEPASEYSVVVEVRDQQGKVLTRRVVGVGAIRPGDSRGFALRVEVQSPAMLTPAPEPAPARSSKAD